MFRRERDPLDIRKDGLVRSGIRALSGGVGLLSESSKNKNVGKSPSQTPAEEQRELEVPDASAPPAYFPSPEFSAAASEKKSAAGPVEEPIVEDDLEQEWALDDAQDVIIGKRSGPPDYNEIEISQSFVARHPPPSAQSIQGLRLPVVLPQRRPKDRSRGFVRAYAPILENAGIDETTWMDFLDTFTKSSLASPWLNVINLASIGSMFIPHGLGFLAGFAINQITATAIEFQSRERSNNFLTDVNKSFFQPRGLYCLVMTWNPHSAKKIEQVNISSTIESRMTASGGVNGLANSYRSSDGKGWGEFDFPEVAPLVYPALDHYGDRNGAAERTTFLKTYGFVANYWDKRATAQYSLDAPNSILAQAPQQEFTSRYADPKSHAGSGSMIAFLSGGKLIPNPESKGLIGGLINVSAQSIRGEKQGSGWDREAERYQQHLEAHGSKAGFVSERKAGMIGRTRRLGKKARMQGMYGRGYQGGGCPIRKATGGKYGLPMWRGGMSVSGMISTPVMEGYKKLLGKNVLYLMVVNMPTEEEMAAAKAAFL